MQMRTQYELSQFGSLCKRGRSPFAMTRFEMAKKLKVSSLLVSDIESGKMQPSDSYVCAVTGLLCLSTADVRAALAADQLAEEINSYQPIARP